jgi:hypothetical protein
MVLREIKKEAIKGRLRSLNLSDRYRNKRVRSNPKFRVIFGAVNLRNRFGIA